MPRGFQSLLAGGAAPPSQVPSATPVDFRQLQEGNLGEIDAMEAELERLAPLADAGDPRAMGQYSALMQRIRQKEERQHQMYLREHQAGGITGGFGEAASELAERKRFKQPATPGAPAPKRPILP